MCKCLHVVLARHAESESNAGLPSTDASSPQLTSRGQLEAAALAETFECTPARFVVSAYERSRQTAAPALSRYPAVPVEEWPVHEFTYLSPADYAHTTVTDRRPSVGAYWTLADPHRVMGPGAESFAAFLERVQGVRERLQREMRGPVIVFSHKKFISALIWSLLVGPPKVSRRRMVRYRAFDSALALPNAARIDVRFGPGGPWVGAVCTSHLRGVEA